MTTDNPTGAITNSNLELSGVLLHLQAVYKAYDVRECTLLCKTENFTDLFWHQKVSATTDKCPHYLLAFLKSTNVIIDTYCAMTTSKARPILSPMTPLASFTFSTNNVYNICLQNISSPSPITYSQSSRYNFSRDLGIANEALKSGVSSSRARAATAAWEQW